MDDHQTDRSTRRIDLLARQEFFAAVPHELLARIAQRMHARTARAGELIFAKDDEGDSLFAVAEGLVKISALSIDGREVVLNLIGARQIFGEISLLDGLPRTADATALTDCRLLVLGRAEFRALLLEEPLLGVKLLEIVGRRLRATSLQVEALSFQSPTARLARALLRLAELTPRADRSCPLIALTQQEIGQAAGLSRESTNKKLRAWAREGIVELRSGACVVLDPEALGRISHDARCEGGAETSGWPPGRESNP